jgi:hypothetical protein
MTEETDRIEAQINRSRHALNDTIEQLGGKLSPGQILDEALGLAQGQAGHFTANLGRQVRDNPLPVLLVGAGIAMLFLHKKNGQAHASSAQWSEEDWGHESRYRDLEAARANVIRRTDETDEEYEMRVYEAEARVLGMQREGEELPEAFRQRVKGAGEKLSHTVKGVRDRMGSAMHAVGSGVGHAAHAVGAGVGAMTHGVGSAAHAVSSGVGKAKDFVGDQTANLKEGLASARYKTQDLYNEYPLAAGAIGLGIGALIGAMTPLTNTEREQLQGVADAAAKAGADLAEKGARAVERTTEKATAALH